ncbi:hypothetical protein [Paraburkholderia sacchari]|nr:hypothetical protein [Paraburkholderia sacchari]
MKKTIFSLVIAAVAIGSMSSAFADNHHRCHKVKVHHHWETRCHH